VAHSCCKDEDADDHVVRLSRQAIAALRELLWLTGSYALVFPDESNLSKPMSEIIASRVVS